MKVLNKDYEIITVDCTSRLNQLINRFYTMAYKKDNVWFNRGLKNRLKYHIGEISHHIHRHIILQNDGVILSIEVKRKFGTRDKYENKILVKNRRNRC